MGFIRGDENNNDNKQKLPYQLLDNDVVQTSMNFVNSFANTWTFHQTIVLGVGCTATFLLGIRLGRSHLPWRRITSVSHVSSKMLGAESPWLRGRVVKVSDGDTLRFWHTPTWLHTSTPVGKISEVCLPIRICTIDTPETAKFGSQGQPFGDNAKEYLSQLLLDTSIQVQLLEKDQYGRLVASVRQRKWLGFKYMDEVMLQAGFAEVYLGSGAMYGAKGKDHYLKLQEQARTKKKGMWSQKNHESAADFKARTKDAAKR